jgi:glycosyltransferase involved in cell wall biosynthesis
MVTNGRPDFARQAVDYFRRQDHLNRELVIIDNGGGPLADVEDDRVRVLRLSAPCTVGTARNIGAEAARGYLIAHWDDDDWMGSGRLRLAVAALADQQTVIAGLRTFVRYEAQLGRAWRYTPLATDAPFLAGASLVYRRDWWIGHPFPDRDVGEDAAFLGAVDESMVAVLSDDDWFVAVGHGRNTAPVNFADPRWAEIELSDVLRRFGSDASFYAAVRRGTLRSVEPAGYNVASSLSRFAAPDKGAAGRAGDAVTVVGDLLVYDGLGSMTEYGARSLARAGVDVRVRPISLDRRGLHDETLALLDRPHADGPLLFWSWPRSDLAVHAQRSELFVRTAWESTALPTDWPRLLENCRAVLVPSAFVADACRASGVTVPVVVVPDGIDPEVYSFIDRPDHEGITVLAVGTLIGRKRMPAVVASWQRAFGDDPHARLLIKARFRAGHVTVDDPRITVVDDNEPTRGIAHWYAKADVLLALGNEGFGLPLVEAMATGLPVVALDAEGQHDVCREADGVVLRVPAERVEPFDDPRYGRCGEVSVPSIQVAADHLAWVASHRGEARDMGRSASAWALHHRDVWAMGASVLEAMEQRVVPSRRLRPRRAMWVPSWRQRCGVGEYSADLVRSLPGIEVVASEPTGRADLRLVHVQHETSLLDDADLERYLDAADWPVTVTEHSVGTESRGWESKASALVALTAEGVNRLAQRAPGRRVLRMDMGCPTWFPPRKHQRGRVIGAFGFLEAHKGFFGLLAAVRELEGVSLELHSYPKWSAIADRFAADCSGLDVSWHRQYLPVDEIARRLAATCDVVVFWYDEVPTAAASAAVRVALASGVPVLTSRTTWFADVADVTYQPADLVEGLERLLDDSELRAELVARARDYCHAHAWPRVAAQHLQLWQELESA